MPLYAYQCQKCNTREDHFRKVAERDSFPDHCSRPMRRLVTAAMVAPDLPLYFSPIDGRPVEGRRARLEDLRRNGCRPYEGGEREAAIRYRREADAALDSAFDETVERAVEALPVRKKEKLAAELEAGLDVEVARL